MREETVQYKKYAYPENVLVYARLEDCLPLTEEKRKALEYVLSKMPPRREDVVRLYFQENMTQTQIGKAFGVSGNRVGYLLHEAARILRQQENRECINLGYSAYMEKLQEKEIEDGKRKEYIRNHPEAIRIRDAGFTAAAERAFINTGLRTVGEVAQLLQQENYFFRFRSYGSATDRKVKERLRELGVAWEAEEE